ncbi:MAG: glutamate synthase [Spirochaetia bacterium]|jgi:glutamate synthase domain-containing protein 3|nr:glutamate synthase [Spirochaetia bacterium]
MKKQNITVGHMNFKELNDLVRESTNSSIELNDVQGQRFIGAGMKDKTLSIYGVPGNALGACMNSGSQIIVNNDCQDAIGDTMNDGMITVCGNCGDTAGYAMRGGAILIKESAGYRIGIHMKAYKEKQPVIIIGDKAGSFLGEYLAGGTIIVLGMRQHGKCPVGNFCGTGMHGGQIFLRTDELPKDLPPQIKAEIATKEDLESIDAYLELFCTTFSFDKQQLLDAKYYKLTPNSTSPYKQLYTAI